MDVFSSVIIKHGLVQYDKHKKIHSDLRLKRFKNELLEHLDAFKSKFYLTSV